MIRHYTLALILALLPSIPMLSAKTGIGTTVMGGDTQECDTSSAWFAMPTTEICGAWDCNPSGGVPNANLAEAMDEVALDLGPDCAGCVWRVGCFPDATVIPGPGIIVSNEQSPDPSCPSGYIYRRCIHMPNGEAFITCGPCPD